MVTTVNLKTIIVDFFYPPQFGEKAKISLWRLFAFAVLPIGLGGAMAIFLPTLPSSYQGTFFQIFALVATVFTAMMPIVQAVAQHRTPAAKYTKAQAADWKGEVTRLDVLRSLYSALTWAVLLTIAAVVPLLVLQIESLPEIPKRIVAGVIYAISISIAFIFIDVVVGIYLLLADETKSLEAKLRHGEPD